MDEETDPRQDMVQLHRPFPISPPGATQYRHLDVRTWIPKRESNIQADSRTPPRRRRERYPPTPPGYELPVYELPPVYALPEQPPPPPMYEPPAQPSLPTQENVVIPDNPSTVVLHAMIQSIKLMHDNIHQNYYQGR